MQPNLFPKNGKIEDGRTGGQGVGLFIRAVDLGRRQIGKSGQWRQLGPVGLNLVHMYLLFAVLGARMCACLRPPIYPFSWCWPNKYIGAIHCPIFAEHIQQNYLR